MTLVDQENGIFLNVLMLTEEKITTRMLEPTCFDASLYDAALWFYDSESLRLINKNKYGVIVTLSVIMIFFLEKGKTNL